MHVAEIKTKEDFANALKNEKFKATVVDFTATWCGPCQMIKPYFHELAEIHTDVQFLQVDVDELDSVAGDAGVTAMPTFQLYIEGKKESELVGGDKKKLLDLIMKVSGKTEQKADEKTIDDKKLEDKNDEKKKVQVDEKAENKKEEKKESQADEKADEKDEKNKEEKTQSQVVEKAPKVEEPAKNHKESHAVIVITSKEDFENYTKQDKLSIVDFTATWCGPCQLIKPFFHEKSNEFKDKINFLQVDVDDQSKISEEAGVRAMPTFQIYKSGKKIDELVGANKDKLIELITKNNK